MHLLESAVGCIASDPAGAIEGAPDVPGHVDGETVRESLVGTHRREEAPVQQARLIARDLIGENAAPGGVAEIEGAPVRREGGAIANHEPAVRDGDAAMAI